MVGAESLDDRPMFPLPHVLTLDSTGYMRAPSPRLQAVLLQVDTLASSTNIISQALKMTSSVACIVNLNSHSDAFWKRDLEAISLIGPCLHLLLRMPRFWEENQGDEGREFLVVRELVRMVCLLLMTALKELFGMVSGERFSLESKLANFLKDNIQYVTNTYADLRTWIAITAAALQQTSAGAADMLRLRSAGEPTIQPLQDSIAIAREMIWIDIVESPVVDLWTNHVQSA